MRIIEKRELGRWERRRRRAKDYRRVRNALVSLLIVGLLGAGGYYRYQRPLPVPVFVATNMANAAAAPKISWPEYGQSAVGTIEEGFLADSGAGSPVPIASVAKTVTALVVLDAKPLKINQQGPAITLTAADEAIYHAYIAKGGSVSGVTAGKTMTQYEALQALMLPSSNNISETLTNWAFGSQAKYVEAANKFLRKQGFKRTTIADSSGFSPQTVSTAAEVVKIGVLAMKHPVLAQIVAQKEAASAVSGPIMNVNRLLGVNGTVGIKTGNTDEAGGCFLLATEKILTNGEVKTIIVAVLGAPTLGRAMLDTQPLAAQTVTGFRSYTALSKGQQLGQVTTAWGAQSAVLAKEKVTLFGWGNEKLKLDTKPALGQLSKGTNVGLVTVKSRALQSQTIMVLSDELPRPTSAWLWRRIFSK